MKKTGWNKEYSDYVQKHVFDKGHEVEALARPIVEKLIGDELYPVVGVLEDTNLSASFDGLNMFQNIIFEHKQWNEELASSVRNGIIPDSHMPQIQQQLLVSGAEKCVFVVSDGTEENMETLEVKPCKEWFKKITNGWKQFSVDLSNYEYKEIKEKPIGKAIAPLPLLSLQISGSVDSTNLPLVRGAVIDLLANVKTELITEQDFGDAQQIVKFCKKAEDELKRVKEDALNQTESISNVLNTIDDMSKQLRDTRLTLDKLVKTETARIKNEKNNATINNWNTFVANHEERFKGLPQGLKGLISTPDFALAIKGVRSNKGLAEKLDTALANAKIKAFEVISSATNNLDFFDSTAENYKFLFSDLQDFILLPSHEFSVFIDDRVNGYEEAQRLKKQQQLKEQERLQEEQKLKELERVNEVSTAPNNIIQSKEEPADVKQTLNEYSELDEIIFFINKNSCSRDVVRNIAKIIQNSTHELALDIKRTIKTNLGRDINSISRN